MSLADKIKVAVERYRLLFELYDEVVVSISGGKDSTCILELGRMAAAAAGRRVQAAFWDQEIQYPETVAYLARLQSAGAIDLTWYCVPIRSGNAWDTADPHWYPWAPEAREVWARAVPAGANTVGPVGYRPQTVEERLSLGEKIHHIAHARLPRTYCETLGRRTEESPVRKAMGKAIGWHQAPNLAKRRYAAKAYPILEWTTREVWQFIRDYELDWNRAYLRMWQGGLSAHQSRIGQWFGEEPSIALHLMRKLAPEPPCARVRGCTSNPSRR